MYGTKIYKDGREYVVWFSYRRLPASIVKKRGLNGWTMHEVGVKSVRPEKIEDPIFPRGGITYAYVYGKFDKGYNEYRRGVAVCSIKDNFDKKLGRKIALGRAFNNRELPKKVYK